MLASAAENNISQDPNDNTIDQTPGTMQILRITPMDKKNAIKITNIPNMYTTTDITNIVKLFTQSFIAEITVDKNTDTTAAQVFVTTREEANNFAKEFDGLRRKLNTIKVEVVGNNQQRATKVTTVDAQSNTKHDSHAYPREQNTRQPRSQ